MNKDKFPHFRFTVEEFVGALGDSFTVIPIIAGMALISEINLAYVLLFLGIFQIASGLYYRLPMPIEPMKALGALVIAGSLSYMEAVASGMILGLILLGLGFFNLLKRLEDRIPESLIRGVQLGLGLILIKISFQFALKDPILATVSGLIVTLFLFIKVSDLSPVIILLIGLGYGAWIHGLPHLELITYPEIVVPSGKDFLRGCYLGVLPQLALTIPNAIFATRLLFKDLLDKEVNSNRLAQSIGFMCLIASPLGGFPTCHGSGGLAGQYRFGARTGGSNIILGTIYLLIAMFSGGSNPLSIFPLGALFGLLFFTGLELGTAGTKTDSWVVTLATGLLALVTNIAIGFLVGLFIWWVIKTGRGRVFTP